MDEAAFDTAPGNKKNLRVLLVVPPTGDNPWRTHQDYEDDQRRMLSLYRWTMVSVAAACLSAVAAIGALAVSIHTLRSSLPARASQPALQQPTR